MCNRDLFVMLVAKESLFYAGFSVTQANPYNLAALSRFYKTSTKVTDPALLRAFARLFTAFSTLSH